MPITATVTLRRDLSATVQIESIRNQAPPADGRAVNSNATYTLDVPSGGTETIADTTITAKNSDGDTIAGPTGFPSGVAADMPIPDTPVQLVDSAENPIGAPVNVESGVAQEITAPDAQAVLKDTAGNTLFTTAIKSNESKDIEAPDATVNLRNSDNDDLGNVTGKSGGTTVGNVPDTEITVLDGEGNTLATEDMPSGVPGQIVVAPALTRSLSFNGTSDYLEADNVEALFLSAPVTLSFWLKPPTDKGGTSQYVFTAAEQASENNRFVLVFGGNVGGANQVLYISAGNRAAAYVDAVNSYANVWTHFVVVCTGSTWQLYVNGSLVTLTALTATSSPYGDFCDTFSTGEKDFWRWMSRPRVTGFAEGYLDEVSMWDKVLTLAEVGELRDGTTPANLQQHSAVDNMFAWWGNGDFWRDAVDGSLGRNRANRIYDKGADGYNLTPSASMTIANISNDVPT